MKKLPNKIDIKHRITGEVIYSHVCENNTIKLTVEHAVKNRICLNNADLCGADLRYADLNNADLRYADLNNADLNNANLSGANLRYADLNNADLSGANLRYADLNNADLRYADLRYADLRYADLRYADLSGADLRYADLSGAKLEQTRGINYALCCFPSHGERGRQLLAVEIENNIILYCGCFKGSEKELKKYIKTGEEIYKKSRLLALKTVLKLITFNNK